MSSFLSSPWSIRAVGTFVAFVGCFVHSLIIIIIGRKSSDHNAFSLLMQFSSLFSILRLFFGWIHLLRFQSIPTGNVVFVYGIGGLISEHLVNVANAISSICVVLNVITIPLLMIIRAFLIFNRRLAARHIYIIVLAITAFVFPFGIAQLNALSSLVKDVVPPEFANEAAQVSLSGSYASRLHPIFTIYSRISFISLPLSILLRFVILRQMKDVESSMSSETHKLHHCFINLLTMESLALLLGFLSSGFRLLVDDLRIPISQEIVFLFSLYSQPIFALIPVIQGISTLFFIPFMRKSVYRIFFCSQQRQIHTLFSKSGEPTPNS